MPARGTAGEGLGALLGLDGAGEVGGAHRQLLLAGRGAGTQVALDGGGVVAVAEDDPPTLEELDAYRVQGRAWVVAGEDDVAVGYLLLDVVDGAARCSALCSARPRTRWPAPLEPAVKWAAARDPGFSFGAPV